MLFDSVTVQLNLRCRSEANSLHLIFGPPHDCPPSEESDQPGHPLCVQWVAKDPSFLYSDSEDSDQTGRMPRMIWVLAGRTCHFVGFVMKRLIYREKRVLITASLCNALKAATKQCELYGRSLEFWNETLHVLLDLTTCECLRDRFARSYHAKTVDEINLNCHNCTFLRFTIS